MPFCASNSARNCWVGVANIASRDPPCFSSRKAMKSFSRCAFWRKYPDERTSCSSSANRNRRMPSTLNTPASTKVCQRPFHVRPRSVLSEDGAGDHLERSLSRPPMLWSPRARQLAINRANRPRWRSGTLRLTCGLRVEAGARRHGCDVLPCLSCCFQPRTRALLASASASGTMPLR